MMCFLPTYKWSFLSSDTSQSQLEVSWVHMYALMALRVCVLNQA